jgi:hypothetical protein
MAEKEFKQTLYTTLNTRKDGSIKGPDHKLKKPTTSYPWHAAS